jgi:hypothetical protein
VPELRTFELAGGGSVVAARGELDVDAVEQLAARVRATYVARRPLSDALAVVGAEVAPALVAAPR